VEAALQGYGVQLATLRREQDRHDEVFSALWNMSARFAAAPAWRCGLVLFACEMGRADDALAGVASLEGFEDFPRDVNWLAAMSTLAITVYRLGRVDWAARLYSLLVAFEDRFVVVGGVAASACYGSVAYYLGLLAAACGQVDDAVRHFERALERNAAIGAAPWIAHTQAAFAEVLGTGERAASLRAAAREGAQRLGMQLLLRQLTADPATAV
jgi:tetratricopeptide (TPR) repeat protein